MRSKPTIVVWFSCGAASAVAAKLTIEAYGDYCNIRVVNNPIAEENPDNIRFLNDVSKWLGVEIETATNKKYPSCSIYKVFEDRKYISGVDGAPCTGELKKNARQQWEDINHHDYMVMGFTVEEQKRYDRFVKFERDNLLPVLIDAGLNKQDCLDIVVAAGIMVPEMYVLGFPNANCETCVKATSPTYWNLVRLHFPEKFNKMAAFSRTMGVRLVRYKGKRIFLDELPEDAQGRPIKKLNMPDCGIFCEEKF